MVQDGYSYLYGPVRRGEGEWSKMAIDTCMVLVRRGEGEWFNMVIATGMVQLEEEKESGRRCQ